MSEENENVENVQEDELEALKARANQMGLKFHPNIGLENLRERVNAAVKGEPAPAEEPEPAAPAAEYTGPVPQKESENDRRIRLRQEANTLKRVRITCMNPNKRDWDGEIFTCGNKVVGTYKKFVPFGVVWHVPQILLTMIEEKQCQLFRTVTTDRGQKMRQGYLAKEFGIEYLDDLTTEELKDLAQRQAMASGTPE